MSAFVVSDSTVNRLVTFLERLPHQSQGPLCHLRGAFNVTPDKRGHEFAWARLARRMASMNIRAVVSRYEGRARDMIGDKFEFGWESCRNPWQVLKSFDCFLYQCSEGDIPDKSELFKRLDKVREDLALLLATSTPQYNAAKWE